MTLSVNCNASSSGEKNVYTVTDLEAGTHTIKVVVDKTGSYLSAAGAVVYGASGSEQTVSFSFEGTGFNIVGGGSTGSYGIVVDGKELSTQTASGVGQREASVRVRNLSYGKHQATVKVSTGTLYIDAIEIMGKIDGTPEEMKDDYSLEDAMFKLQQAVESYKIEDKDIYSKASMEKFEEAYEYARRIVEENWGDCTDVERLESYYNKLVAKYDGLVKKGSGDTLENPITYTSFTGTNGDTWYDTDGTEIQAHGGQVLTIKENGKNVYYWYGEDKTNGDYRVVDGGVRVYRSTDLYNWENMGRALHDVSDEYDFEEDYFAKLYGEGCEIPEEYDSLETYQKAVLLGINDTTSVMERPKVIYNKKNNNYVMWFHADGPTETSTSNYAAASAGLAVSDSPVGPFKYIGRYRLHYIDGAYDSNKGMARDMNLFVDDDDKAYIIYSSEENATLFISLLDDDYTGLAVDPDKAAAEYAQTGKMDGFNRIPCYASNNTISGVYKREGPAIFKYNGTYYLMTSGCTGWGANQATYGICTGDILDGSAWKNVGDPCITDTSVCKYTTSTTFGTQSTNILAIDASKAEFIYMGDRWNTSSPATNELVDPKYVWLPIQFTTDGEMVIYPNNNWSLEDLGVINYSVKLVSELPESIERDTLTNMPEQVEISYADETFTSKVLWSVKSGDISKAGSYATLEGKLVDFKEGKTTIDAQVYVLSKEMKYFIDCGVTTDTNKTSEGYELANGLLNNAPDGFYSEETGWGLVEGTIDGTKGYSNEFGKLLETGYYGANDGSKNPTYKVTLDAGNYELCAGMTEWWNNKRGTKVIVNYEKADGTTYEKEVTKMATDGTKGARIEAYGTFEVADDHTVVTISFERDGSGDAAAIAYFAIAGKAKSPVVDAGDDPIVTPEKPTENKPDEVKPEEHENVNGNTNQSVEITPSRSKKKSQSSSTSSLTKTQTTQILEERTALASSVADATDIDAAKAALRRLIAGNANKAKMSEFDKKYIAYYMALTGVTLATYENIFTTTEDGAIIITDGSALTADNVLILNKGTYVTDKGFMINEEGITIAAVAEGMTIMTSEGRVYPFSLRSQIAGKNAVPGKSVTTQVNAGNVKDSERVIDQVIAIEELNSQAINESDRETLNAHRNTLQAGSNSMKDSFFAKTIARWYLFLLGFVVAGGVILYRRKKRQ